MPNDDVGGPPSQPGHVDAPLLALSFGELIRTFRERIWVDNHWMTQAELTEKAGLGKNTVSLIERGIIKVPRYDTVKRLCTALALTGEKCAAVKDAWERAKKEPRLHKPSGSRVSNRPAADVVADMVADMVAGTTLATTSATTGAVTDGERISLEFEHAYIDDAPSASALFSRHDELALLRRLVVDERCRVIATIGLRGMGKTNLVAAFVRGSQDADAKEALAHRFRYVIWLTLIGGPHLDETLKRIIGCISDQQETDFPDSEDDLLRTLFSYLYDRSCLIVLDNVETILASGADVGHYQAGYEGYGKLLRQFAERPHRGCLLLTSRVMPDEVAQLETKFGPVRVLPLAGIDAAGCQAIFGRIDDSFAASDADWERLTRQYDGSPLALDLAARHIRASYGRSVATFLRAGNKLFHDLDELLDWYFERFSEPQKEALYWLACAREPITLDALSALLVSPLSQRDLPSTLQSLQQSLPIQQAGASFTLQPVLIEYMSARLIKHMVAELTEERVGVLNSHAALLAQAKDYIRDIHRRVFLDPILQQLEATMSQAGREDALWRLLRRLQRRPPPLRGYAAGNLLNLLIYMGADLSGRDLSRLYVRQAYLRETSLVDVNFSDATFEQSVFTDTFGNVLSVAFSPGPRDTAVIAAGTGTGEIRLWRASDGTPLATYRGHSDWVWGLAYSGNGRLLASGSGDTTIRLWDTANDKCLFTLTGHESRVRSVAFSPDGKQLASASEDWKIGLWDVESGELIRFLTGHERPVREVAFTPDGATLVSCSDDATVRVWDLRAGSEKLPPLEGHYCPVWSLAVSPDGQTIATGGDDHRILLWDLASGEPTETLVGHTGWICSLAFSPTSDVLASASGDTSVRLWNLATDEPFAVLRGHRNWVNSVRFHASGKTLASGSHDQTVRLWDTDASASTMTLQGYNNGVRAVAFSPSGNTLATADRSVRLWNPNDGTIRAVLSGHSTYVRTLAWSRDERYLASGSDDYSSRIWLASAARLYRTLVGHTNRVKSVAFSPDGSLLATGSDDSTVRLWDVDTPSAARVLEGHKNRIRAVAFSPTGSLVGSGSDDETARLWDTRSAEVVHILRGHGSRIWSIAFSPRGDLFATGSEDSEVRIWDSQTGKCVQLLHGHTLPVWAIAFHPDGAIVASSSEDTTIRLWDVASGECLQVLRGHTKPVWALAFSPDQVHLASGSHDRTVRLWNGYTGKEVTTLGEHQDTVWFVAFHPNGALLASGGDDGVCHVWDVHRRALAHTLRGARLYERMNIYGVTGLNEAQIQTLQALGAIETCE